MIRFPRGRAGLTLIELMLSMILASILGIAVLRLLIGESRYLATQEASQAARGISRQGLQLLQNDLRMVEADSGLMTVTSSRDVILRVPYAMGLMCGIVGSDYIVSLFPVDSVLYAQPGHSGWAYRETSGRYSYVRSTVVPAASSATICRAQSGLTDSVVTLGGGGRMVALRGTPPTTPLRGGVVFLYRHVRYRFDASTAISGRRALWRTLEDASRAEELLAPFDTTARFRFLMQAGDTIDLPTVAQRDDVRGLLLILDGASEATPGGRARPETQRLSTAVWFANRRD